MDARLCAVNLFRLNIEHPSNSTATFAGIEIVDNITEEIDQIYL